MRRWCVALLMLACAVPGYAQSKDSDGRVYVEGLAGAAWSDGNSTGLFAGQAGVRVFRHLFVFGEGGTLVNVLPSVQREELGVIGRIRTALDGAAPIDGRLTSWYGLGGARWQWMRTHWGPYAEAGVGAAVLFTHVSGDTSSGDVRTELVGIYPDDDTTQMMWIVGAGTTFWSHARWNVDAGYRYSRIQTTSAISVNSVHGAIRFRF